MASSTEDYFAKVNQVKLLRAIVTELEKTEPHYIEGLSYPDLVKVGASQVRYNLLADANYKL